MSVNGPEDLVLKTFCRAWLRKLINQKALEYNVRTLTSDVNIAKMWYYDQAIMADIESASLFTSMMAALNEIGFELTRMVYVLLLPLVQNLERLRRNENRLRGCRVGGIAVAWDESWYRLIYVHHIHF